MKVSIIGGAGKMGKWFIQHFKDLGYTVIASDPRSDELRKIADSLGIISKSSNTTAVMDSDVVLIAVPMEQIADVIREVSPHMKQNAVLCEISSIKQNVLDALMEVSENQVQPLCIHPLFGPGPGALTRRMALIPIYDAQSEKSLVEDLFPGIQTILTSAEEHDKAMAFIISLPYFINTILASILAEEDLDFLQQLGGTTFTVQLMLMGSVMFNSPELHIALHKENAYAPDILNRFHSRFAEGISLFVDNLTGFREFYTNVREDVERFVNLEERYLEMYHILEIMNSLESREVDS
jgi:prephenate dehydrogenase